jgi:hypothetical protein
MRPDESMDDPSPRLIKNTGAPAISAQQQADLATEYLKQFFGADPANLTSPVVTSTDSTSDEHRAEENWRVPVQRYSWMDAKPDADGWRGTYAVDLFRSRLFSSSRTFKGTEGRATSVNGDLQVVIASVVLIALMAPTFFAARLYRMLFQRRLLLIICLPILIFLLSGTAAYFALRQGEPPWLAVITTFFVAAFGVIIGAVLCCMFLSTEHLVVSRWPGKWSTTASLLRLKVAGRSGVPLAIMRGAALGAVATGIYSLLRFIGVRYGLALWIPSSHAAAELDSISPPLTMVVSSGIWALTAALVLAFCISLARRYSRNSLVLIGVGSLIWLLTGIYVTMKDVTPPLLFEWFVVFIFASIVCFALVRYDFLTQFICLFSSYLLLTTYATWALLSDVGNFQYTAVFLIGGAAILLSTFLAFREGFVEARARLAKIYE